MKKKFPLLLISALLVLLCAMFTSAVVATWVIASPAESKKVPDAERFPVNYKFRFDAGEGEFEGGEKSFESKEQTARSGDEVTLEYDSDYAPEKDPSRVGYTFAGYKHDDELLNSQNKSMTFSIGDEAELETTFDLKSEWEVVKYTIKFDTSGTYGEVTPPEVIKDLTIEEGHNTTSLSKVSAPGYDFKGWKFDDDNKFLVPSDGGDITFTLTEEIVLALDGKTEITLKAIWTAIEYKVTYDDGMAEPVVDGDEVTNMPDEDTKSYHIGDTINISDKVPHRIGFIFLGWKDSGDDKSPLYKHGDNNNGSYTMKDRSVTFVAQWKAIDYTVKFENGGISHAQMPSDMELNLGNSNRFGTASASGYMFEGWTLGNETFDLLTLDLIKAAKVDENSENNDKITITLTAKWKTLSYTVKFDTTHNNVELLEKKFEDKTDVTLDNAESKKFPTKEEVENFVTGYTFEGWTLGGSGTKYTQLTHELIEASKLQIGGTITLKAVWKAIEYTVTFDSKTNNNATLNGNSLPRNIEYDLDMLEDQRKFGDAQADGYSFKGWQTEDNKKYSVFDKQFIEDAIGKNKTAVTLYAQWNVVNYTITFVNETDNGATAPNPLTVTLENDISQRTFATLSATGYVFNGWYLEKQGGNKYTVLDEKLIEAANGETKITLYAQWTIINYKVVYELMGGQGDVTDEKTYTIKDTISIPENEPTQTGYVFRGWYIGDQTTLYKHDDKSTVALKDIAEYLATLGSEDPTITFKALWEEIGFHVTYEEGETEVETTVKNMPTDDKTYKVGEGANTITVSETEPSRKGYTFDGWLLKGNDGNEKKYSGGEIFTVNSDSILKFADKDSHFTFVAQWKVKEYNVTFNQGTDEEGKALNSTVDLGNLDSTTVTIENGLDSVLDAAAKGYTFKKWTLTINDETKPFTGNSFTLKEEDIDENNEAEIVFTATWTTNSYTIKYVTTNKANSPVTNNNVSTIKIGETVTLNDAQAKGYTFKKWTVTINDKEKVLSEAKSFTLSQEDISNDNKSDITATAEWELIVDNTVKLVAVYIDENGKRASSELTPISNFNIEMTEDALKEALNNNGAKDGYEFDGWHYSENDNSKVELTVRAIYDNLKNGEVTLYAYHKIRSLTATYKEIEDDMIGSGEEKEINYYVTDTNVLTSAQLGTHDGYTFMGWYYDEYKPENKIGETLSGAELLKKLTSKPDTILIAYYAKNYTVTYKNGIGDEKIEGDTVTGMPGTDNTPHHVGDTITLPNSDPSRVGFTFTGWQVESEANGFTTQTLTKGATFTMPAANVTATAQWTAIEYTIVLETEHDDKNEAFTKFKDKKVSFSDSRTIELPKLGDEKNEFEGYMFEGWQLVGEGDIDGKDYKLNGGNITFELNREIIEKFVKDGKLNFKAIWSKITYTVKFSGETHGNTASDQTGLKVGENISIPSDWTATGYKFNGWKLKGDESDKIYTSSDTTLTAEMIRHSVDHIITFTAQWTAIKYTIKFADSELTDDGIEVKINEKSINEYTLKDVTLDNADSKKFPTKDNTTATGYVFASWYYGTERESNYDKSKEYSVLTAALIEAAGLKENTTDNQTITLYAHWTEVAYTVQYVSGAKEGDVKNMPNKKSVSLEDPEIELGTPTRTGYDFSGWTISVGETKVDNKETYISGENNKFTLTPTFVSTYLTTETAITFTANWTAIEYNIDYKSEPKESSNMPSDTKVSLDDPTVDLGDIDQGKPNLSGYEFAGWKVSVNGTEVDSSSNGITKNNNSYTFTLTAEFIEKNSLTKDTNITITATWKAHSYKVTYEDGVSGDNTNSPTVTGVPKVESHVTDEEVTVSDQKPTREGYTFIGWKATKGLEEITITDGKFTMPASDVILTAKWELIEYTVIFDLESGENVPSETQPETVDSITVSVEGEKISGKYTPDNTNKYKFSVPTVSAKGYVFGGWNNAEFDIDLSGEIYSLTEENIKKLNESGKTLTLTAKWSKVDYTIHYNIAGSEKGLEGDKPSDQIFDVDDETITLASVNVKTGYRFNGWYKTGDYEEKIEDESVTFDEILALFGESNEITLYGKIEAIKYNIILQSDEDETTISDVTLESSESFMTEVPTKEGYICTGWKLGSGTGVYTQLTEGLIKEAKVTGTADGQTITLIPNWEAISYKVVYSGEGVSDVVDNTTYTLNGTSEITLQEKPTTAPEGKYFNKWTISGNEYDAGDKVNLADVIMYATKGDDAQYIITFTATWTAIVYNIEYKSEPKESNNMPSDTEVSLDEPTVDLGDIDQGKPNLLGYDFDGWKVSVNGMEVDSSSNGITKNNNSYTFTLTAEFIKMNSLTEDDKITITATWTAHSYKVTYEGGVNGDNTNSVTVSNLPEVENHVTDEAVTISSQKPTREGYIFKNWKATKGGDEFTVTDDKFTMPASDVILTAEWELIEYTVIFDLESGENVPSETQPETVDSITVSVEGEKINGEYIPDKTNKYKFNVPTVSAKGYIFGGWNNAEFDIDLKDMTYTLTQDNIAMLDGSGKTLTLTAKWSKIDYIIHYNISGIDEGIEGDKSIDQHFSVDYDTITLASVNVKTGYRFNGWYSSSTYTGDKVKDSFTFDEILALLGESNEITLYGKVEAIKYDVTLKFEDDESSIEVTLESPGSFMTDLPTREGYICTGWKLESGTGVYIQLTEELIIEAKLSEIVDGQTITLIPAWEAISYKVVYSGEEVSGVVDDNTYSLDGTSEITLQEKPTTAPEGNYFDKWLLSDNEYDAGASLNLSEIIKYAIKGDDESHYIITFTAKWGLIKYIITFDAEHGAAPKDIEKTIEDKETITFEQPTDITSGYIFDTWEVNKDGKSATFDSSVQLRSLLEYAVLSDDGKTATITMTALWYRYIKADENLVVGIDYSASYKTDAKSAYDEVKAKLLKEELFSDPENKKVSLNSLGIAVSDIKYVNSKTDNAENVNPFDTTVASTYEAIITITAPTSSRISFANTSILASSSFTLFIKLKSVDVNGTLYTIEDALAKATSGTITVKYNTAFADSSIASILYNHDNYHTVKSGVTLILPYNGASYKPNESETVNGVTYSEKGINSTANATGNSTFGNNTYKKLELILPDGFTLTNNGKLRVGGVTSGQQAYAGGTAGDFAQITLGDNAVIDSNGDIDIYGFIAEKSKDNGSKLNMNSGTLRMTFRVYEHRGGSAYAAMVKDGLKGAPFNRYYMENCTALLTIQSTAHLLGYANLYASDQDNTTDIKLVGSGTDEMIQLKEKSYLTMKLDHSTLVADIKIYGSFTLNPLQMTAAGETINMNMTYFPFSYLQQITLLPNENSPATVDCTKQNIKLFPGAKVTIEKNVTVNANNIVIYDNSYKDELQYSRTDSWKIYPNNKGDGQLIVGGTLNAQTVGGTVLALGDGATFISTGNNLTSYELLNVEGSWIFATASWSSYTNVLKGPVYYHDGNKTLTLAAGTYTSKNGGWLTNESTFGIDYHFYVRDKETKAISELNDVEVNINNPQYYTHAGFDLTNAVAEGYDFIGWYKDSNFEDGAAITNIDEWKNSNTTIDIYGLFEKIPEGIISYSLTLDAQEGTVSGNSTLKANLRSDQLADYKLIDALREGYTFDGWFQDKSYSGTKVEKLSEDMFDSDHSLTLYAKWTIINYKLTITIGTGSNLTVTVTTNGELKTYTTSQTNIQVPYGSTVKVTNGGANDGYNSFVVSSTPEGLISKVGDEFTMKQDVTIKSSATKDSSGGVCLVEGTLVTMADGSQKKVEDLVDGDILLAFNHLTGQYEASPMLFNLHWKDPKMWCRVVYVSFSDGTRLGIITEHALYDLDLNEYVYLNEANAEDYIGHRFAKVNNVNGEFVSGEVTLTSVEVKEEFVRRFSPVSGFINVVTEGLLGFTEVISENGPIHGAINIFEFDENMKYDEEKMQADIEKYGLYTYDDFKDYMTWDEFNSFPWAYFKVAVGKGNLTWEDIIWNVKYLKTA